MTAGEIAQIAGLTTAVTVSLVLGVKSLRQTRDLQRRHFRHLEVVRQRELRQKMLDEIIDWSTDIIAVANSIDVPNLCIEDLYAEDSGIKLDYVDTHLFTATRDIVARMEYIKQIIPIFGDELTSLLERVEHAHVEVYSNLFEYQEEGVVTFRRVVNDKKIHKGDPIMALRDNIFELEGAAFQLRKKATEVKLRLINEANSMVDSW